MRQKVLVAVDAGGSKTEYGIRPLSGGEVRHYVYGGSNYKSVGLEKAYANLVTGFHVACEADGLSLEDIHGVVFGLAGCDTTEDMRVFRELVEAIGLDNAKTAIYNDCELAFLATAKAPGFCVVAGTGSNCMAFQLERPVIKAGGLGALLSDGGSGFWIAQKVMRDMLQFCDGSGPNRPIYEGVMRHFEIEGLSSVHLKFAPMGVPEIASCAQLILEYAKDGDVYAREVAHAAHIELWELATTAVGRMAYSPEEVLQVVLNGSLFKNTWFLEQFWDGLSQRIANPMQRHLITAKTSENAMRLAESLYGVDK